MYCMFFSTKKIKCKYCIQSLYFCNCFQKIPTIFFRLSGDSSSSIIEPSFQLNSIFSRTSMQIHRLLFTRTILAFLSLEFLHFFHQSHQHNYVGTHKHASKTFRSRLNEFLKGKGKMEVKFCLASFVLERGHSLI